MKWLHVSTLALTLGIGVSCDDDKGESGDDNADPMSSGEEEGSGEEEAGVEGCVDGDGTIATGEMRACMCMDGTGSTQTCLATGEFGVCDCAGW